MENTEYATEFYNVFKKTEHEEVCEKLEDIYKKLGEVLEKVKPKIIYIPQPYPVYVEVPWCGQNRFGEFPIMELPYVEPWIRYGCDVVS